MILLLFSFLPLLFFGWNGNPVTRAVVSVDGEEVRTIALTTHEGRESFTVETPDGRTPSRATATPSPSQKLTVTTKSA